MKVFKIFILLLCGFIAFSCNKEVTTAGSSPSGASAPASMTATINGTNYTFSGVINNTNGYLVMEGTSSTYTIYLYVTNINVGGQYTFGGSNSSYYAIVNDNFSNTFQTNSSQTGPDLFVTSIGATAGTYNGNFSFTAVQTSGSGSNTLVVTNGTFTNM